MSFTIHCKKLKDALSKVSSALGNEMDQVSISLSKQGTKLAAAGRGLAVEVTISDMPGKAQFTISAESLQRLMVNRKVLECEIVSDSETQIKFSEGRFTGHMNIKPYVEVLVEPDKEGKSITIPPTSGVASHFNAARNSLRLTDKTQPDKEAFLSVRVKNNTIYCLVFDKLHFGRYQSGVEHEGDDLAFNILDSTLRKIMSMTKGSETPYTLRLTQSSVFVEAEDVKASISMEQSDDRQFWNYINLIDVLVKNKQAKCLINGAAISTVVDNMMAIHEPGKPIGFAIGKDGLKLDYTTSYGSIAEVFETKVKGKEAIQLSPELFMDITGAMPETQVEMSVAVNSESTKKTRMLVVSSEADNVVYISAVS